MQQDFVHLSRLIKQNELEAFRSQRYLALALARVYHLRRHLKGRHLHLCELHVVCKLQNLSERLFRLLHLLAVVTDVNIEEILDDTLPSLTRVLFYCGHVFSRAPLRLNKAKLEVLRHCFEEVLLETLVQNKRFLQEIALWVALNCPDLRH